MADIIRIPGGVNITAGIGDALRIGVTIKDESGPLDISSWTLEAQNAQINMIKASEGELELLFTEDFPTLKQWSLRRVDPRSKRLLAGYVQFVTTAGPSTSGETIEVTLEDAPDLIVEVFDAGVPGPEGPGIPEGGAEFDLLEKASGADFDTRFTNTPTVKQLNLDTAAPEADVGEGEVRWNAEAGTADLGLNGGDVVLQVGQETLYRAQNKTGSQIANGTLVVAVGTDGQSGKINIAPWTGAEQSQRIMGLATENIPNNALGYVTHFGKVRGINTTGSIYGEVWANGDIIYAGPNGGLTKVKPDAPASKTIVALVINAHPQVGMLFVRPTFSSNLDDDELVELNGLDDGNVIRYNAANGRFENVALGTAADADVGDFDPAGSAAGVQSNLTTHIQDNTNPHQVTKAQVGLPNVDNVSAANLRDRATHTGEQAIGTITGLQAELDDKATNASLSAHIADDTNPHQVTATQVGLGNVDNTADLDKPISTDTQTALDAKADKTTEIIAGTGLDGGGDLSENRTLNLDSATVASLGLADSALQSGDNVSALTNDAGYIDAAGAPVQSVNTQTGAVSLGAGDVGADPAGSAAAVQSNLDTHTGSSTNVHGIANTADLVSVTNPQLGDIIYRNTSGWERLPAGNEGEVLQIIDGKPQWAPGFVQWINED